MAAAVLGDRFIAGFLLNLGELVYRKEERIMVMPLSGLWSLSLKPEPGTKWIVIACTTDHGCICRYCRDLKEQRRPSLPSMNAS